MNNEYYGVASTPTEDFLAHYGVRGMKWGVRKAVQKGNDRTLARQYRKAEKKLAKLEKRANNGKKYARRAAALGAGAAVMGGAAAAGTGRIGRGMESLGELARNSRNKTVRGIGSAVSSAGNAVNKFGRSTSMSNAIIEAGGKGIRAVGNHGPIASGLQAINRNVRGVSNNTLARIGAGAVGAGLGAGAAYNAYRAATTKKAAKKAAQFRSEMNKAFAGTRYANGRPASTTTKKRKRR